MQDCSERKISSSLGCDNSWGQGYARHSEAGNPASSVKGGLGVAVGRDGGVHQESSCQNQPAICRVGCAGISHEG